MDGVVIIGLLLLGGALIARSAKATAGMDDTPVSIDNIRKGVARGWYTADVYPIAEDDWQTLKAEGYKEA